MASRRPTVTELLRLHHDELTPAERRVAAAIADDPEAVAFGTVAELARRSATGGATVVRLAAKLDLDGFSALQDRIRDELRTRLRPAAQRIREPLPDDPLDRALSTEVDNLAQTFAGIDRDRFRRAVAVLSDLDHGIAVLSGTESTGVAGQLAAELHALRPGVVHLTGSDVAVVQLAATLEPGTVLVAVDFHRYDRAVLDALSVVAHVSGPVIAVTDSELSPLARRTELAFVVAATGAGPFDSKVAALALLQALAVGTAVALVDSATDRLDRAEAAWGRLGMLGDE